LPPNEAEIKPWETLCAASTDPCAAKRPPMLKEQKGKKCPMKIEQEPLILKAVTMIDPAAGWFKIAECDDKRAITAADVAERTWTTRCP